MALGHHVGQFDSPEAMLGIVAVHQGRKDRIAVHAGRTPDIATGALVPPLVQSTTYVQTSRAAKSRAASAIRLSGAEITNESATVIANGIIHCGNTTLAMIRPNSL